MMIFKTPLEYLENLSIEVVNNRFNDGGDELFENFTLVIHAFSECGVFKTMEEYDKAHLLFQQLYRLYRE